MAEAYKTVTVHIRARLRRRGGNQWYKDRSIRHVSTICGAPVTEYDCCFADGKRWKPFANKMMCKNCAIIVAHS